MRVLSRAAGLVLLSTLLFVHGCSDDPSGPEGGDTAPSAILQVDLTDLQDDDPATNLILFRGVGGVTPDTTVTDPGNFPELDLRNFFVTDQTGSGETSATDEALADHKGRTYGRLFLSGHFETFATADIAPTSLGLLATNRAHHDFDVNETALRGQSVFDVEALGFEAGDLGTGGDVYAQAFPFVKIGRWELAPEPPVLLVVDYSDFLDGDDATNTVRFTGVDGALPRLDVVDPGNFPELELRNFFVTDQTGSGETSATDEALADYKGRTYGRLFLSGHFSSLEIADIAPTSLGLLATNRAHHDYRTDETALTGTSAFDLTGFGLQAADFGTGGDLYAQDFPFRKIGRWMVKVE